MKQFLNMEIRFPDGSIRTRKSELPDCCQIDREVYGITFFPDPSENKGILQYGFENLYDGPSESEFGGITIPFGTRVSFWVSEEGEINPNMVIKCEHQMFRDLCPECSPLR